MQENQRGTTACTLVGNRETLDSNLLHSRFQWLGIRGAGAMYHNLDEGQCGDGYAGDLNTVAWYRAGEYTSVAASHADPWNFGHWTSRSIEPVAAARVGRRKYRVQLRGS